MSEPTSEYAVQQAVQKQLEILFSQQNLKTDASLMAQMNSQRFVSFDAVAALPSISALTTDRSIIVAAAAASSQLTVDEEKTSVKPANLKVERTTIILRDIPSTSPIEEVRALFAALASAPTSMQADVGNNWFVTFATEDACMAAALHLRTQTFGGKPVQARVKSENFLSAYKPNTGRAPAAAAAAAAAASASGEAAVAAPNGAYVPQPYVASPSYTGYYDPNFYKYMQQQQSSARGHAGGASQPPASPSKGGRGKGAQQPPSPSGKSRGGGKNEQTVDSGATKVPAAPSQQSQPRPAQVKPRGAAGALVDVAASSGYAKAFTQYSREQIALIVRQRSALPRPQTLIVGQTPAARAQPLADSQLLAAFPVFYPASPSPMLAARSSPALLPSFELGSGGGGAGSSAVGASASSPNMRPLPAALMEAANVSISSSGVALMHYGGTTYSLPVPHAALASGAHSASGGGAVGSFGGLAASTTAPQQQQLKKSFVSPVLAGAKAEAKAVAAAAAASNHSGAVAASAAMPPRPDANAAAAANQAAGKAARRKAGSRTVGRDDAPTAVIDVVASTTLPTAAALANGAPAWGDPAKRTAASIVASNAHKPLQPKRIVPATAAPANAADVVVAAADAAPAVDAGASKAAAPATAAAAPSSAPRTPTKKSASSDAPVTESHSPTAANKPVISYAAKLKSAAAVAAVAAAPVADADAAKK